MILQNLHKNSWASETFSPTPVLNINMTSGAVKGEILQEVAVDYSPSQMSSLVYKSCF
jgi:hypothetical protein